jgi:hypothetical protein
MQNSQDSHSYPLIFIPNWPICQLKISQTGTKVPFPKNLVKPQKGQGLNYCIHILLVDNVDTINIQLTVLFYFQL